MCMLILGGCVSSAPLHADKGRSEGGTGANLYSGPGAEVSRLGCLVGIWNAANIFIDRF